MAYRKNGDKKDARRELKTALASDPKFPGEEEEGRAEPFLTLPWPLNID